MSDISTKSLPKSALPIGIFDSGIGGLSIAQNIKKQLPTESLIYIADNLHAPYGEKSDEFISERVIALGEYLASQPVKAIVVACNTATVTAIKTLREKLAIPIIGVEPAIKPAALNSQNKKVGVLVTQATASNQRLHELIHTYASGADVFIQPCPGLVELIEMQGNNQQAINTLLNDFLSPLLIEQIDTLVLGCTHYPLVKSVISEKVGDLVQIIDTAAPVTAQLKRKLSEKDLLAGTEGNKKGDIFYTTSCNQALSTTLQQLWLQPVDVKNLEL